MDVETAPQVAADDYAAKAELTDGGNVLQRNATLGHNMTVYDALSRGLMKVLAGETGYIVRFRNTVEHVLQDDVFAVAFVFLHLVEVVARAADHIVVIGRRRGVVVTEVNTHEVEFLLQVEMVVGNDTAVVFIGQKGEQTFAEYWLAVGLPQVQQIQPFLEECSQYLILFDKEIG